MALLIQPNNLPENRNLDPINGLLANATHETTAVMIYKSYLPMKCHSTLIDSFIHHQIQTVALQ
jgi:hypothetical protein